jgi:type I restriction enzyme S subunit
LIAEDVNPKYAYYQLLKQDFNSMAKNEAQPFVSYAALNNVLIPVPSKEKQEEIVETLDKFDALVNDIFIGLPAELQTRRQQYEYYRNKLLTFEPLEK